MIARERVANKSEMAAQLVEFLQESVPVQHLVRLLGPFLVDPHSGLDVRNRGDAVVRDRRRGQD